MELVEADDNATTVNTLVSDEQYVRYKFFIYCIVVPTVCLCGLIGNSLAVRVLFATAMQLKQSIYIYMCCLTVVDSMYMVIILARALPTIIEQADAALANFVHAYSMTTLIFFDIILGAMSVCILIVMSIERLIAIRSPLFVKRSLLARRPVEILCAIAIIVVAAVLPLPFCFEVKHVHDGNKSLAYETVVKEEMNSFFDVYMLIETIIVSYFPFIIVLCLNIAIPAQYAMTIRNRRRDSMMTNTDVQINRQMRIMATVFVIIVMYTLLTIPQMYIQTLSVIDERYSVKGSESNMFWFFSDISNTLTAINNAIDFIIYILASSTYRQRFMVMFCHK